MLFFCNENIICNLDVILTMMKQRFSVFKGIMPYNGNSLLSIVFYKHCTTHCYKVLHCYLTFTSFIISKLGLYYFQIVV